MEHTISEAVAPFLQAGLLGSLCVIFGLVIFFLWRESKKERETAAEQRQKERESVTAECKKEREAFIAALQAVYEQRIEDGRVTQQQMLEAVKQCTTAMTTTVTAMEGQHETISELKDLLREMNAILRDRRPSHG